jgi:hypothetical protein
MSRSSAAKPSGNPCQHQIGGALWQLAEFQHFAARLEDMDEHFRITAREPVDDGRDKAGREQCFGELSIGRHL